MSEQYDLSKPFARTAIFAFVILAAIVGFIGWRWASVEAPRTSFVGGPFALRSADRATVTNRDFLGRPLLVYFGYTHCPDACPTTLSAIADVFKKLPDKPVQAVFITVDPERDTPSAMADYVSSFDSHIVGLSGTSEAIGAAEKAYRVYAGKGPVQADGSYSMDHTSLVYLMDKKGNFVEPFDVERPPEQAAAELKEFF